jgi:hypothetical protein
VTPAAVRPDGDAVATERLPNALTALATVPKLRVDDSPAAGTDNRAIGEALLVGRFASVEFLSGRPADVANAGSRAMDRFEFGLRAHQRREHERADQEDGSEGDEEPQHASD